MGELTNGRHKHNWVPAQSAKPRDENRVPPNALLERLKQYEEGKLPLSNLLPYLEHENCWKLFHGDFLFKADDPLVVKLRTMAMDISSTKHAGLRRKPNSHTKLFRPRKA